MAVADRTHVDGDANDELDGPSERPLSPVATNITDDVANNHIHDDRMSESAHSSDEDASHDPDFEMQESPASEPENHDDNNDEDDLMPTRASSTDSNRAGKRKAPAEEDDYIRANPELYGLRRSVITPIVQLRYKSQPLTCHLQTRPREQRKIVRPIAALNMCSCDL